MTTKLLLAVVRGDRRAALVRQLTDNSFHVTEFSSIGGFLRRNSVTLLVGAPEDRIPHALAIIREVCRTPDNADEHYATVFVLNAGQTISV